MRALRPLRRVAALVAVFTIAVTAACNQPAASNMVPGQITLVIRSPGEPVPFTSVRITLTRIAGDTAVDTTVAYPAGAATLNVDLSVPINRSFFSTGEPMSMTLRYQNASGQSVFTAGPATVTVKPK